MVSKVAVIALVAVISVPILLGYALNLTETTETGQKATGESVNVTELLLNGTAYNYAQADSYQLNSDNFYNVSTSGMYPVYVNPSSSSASSVKLNQNNMASYTSLYGTMTNFYFFQVIVTESTVNDYLRLHLYHREGGTDTSLGYIDRVLSFRYTDSDHTIRYSYTNSSGVVQSGYRTDDSLYISCSAVGSFPDKNIFTYYHKIAIVPDNVDLSAGFRLINHNQTVYPVYAWDNGYLSGSIVFPQKSRSVLLTMDLSSITDSNYSLMLGNPIATLEKTTIGTDVTWTITDYYHPENTVELYYDESRSSNVYQIRYYVEPNEDPVGSSTYPHHFEFRYVGDWPTVIGEANYYKIIDFEFSYGLDYINALIFQNTTITPIMRLDGAEYRAYEYQVIENQTYNPINFKANPSTKISNLQLYGDSFTFGGNTYRVSDGKINISGHDIPVDGLVLSSYMNEDSLYENRIGNTLVSTTATPSTITFNGKWSASISTQSIEDYTYTKTEWKAGSFAWDGIDQNFLIVGLITCLGVFIALGIYARKSRSGGIIPLMIVTGCAAAVFFIML